MTEQELAAKLSGGQCFVVPPRACIKPTHEAADAFWKYWRENGETHKHGYYESTWGAINAALACGWTAPAAPAPETVASEVERDAARYRWLADNCADEYGEHERRS